MKREYSILPWGEKSKCYWAPWAAIGINLLVMMPPNKMNSSVKKERTLLTPENPACQSHAPWSTGAFHSVKTVISLPGQSRLTSLFALLLPQDTSQTRQGSSKQPTVFTSTSLGYSSKCSHYASFLLWWCTAVFTGTEMSESGSLHQRNLDQLKAACVFRI